MQEKDAKKRIRNWLKIFSNNAREGTICMLELNAAHYLVLNGEWFPWLKGLEYSKENRDYVYFVIRSLFYTGVSSDAQKSIAKKRKVTRIRRKSNGAYT